MTAWWRRHGRPRPLPVLGPLVGWLLVGFLAGCGVPTSEVARAGDPAKGSFQVSSSYRYYLLDGRLRPVPPPEGSRVEQLGRTENVAAGDNAIRLKILGGVLLELLAGPASAEAGIGMTTELPRGMSFGTLELADNVLVIDLLDATDLPDPADAPDAPRPSPVNRSAASLSELGLTQLSCTMNSILAPDPAAPWPGTIRVSRNGGAARTAPRCPPAALTALPVAAGRGVG